MHYTNNQGLPEPLVRALTNDDYDKQGDISATEMGLPYQLRQLQIRYDDQIEVDVSELIFILFGKAIHYVLERMEIKNAFQEERLKTTVKGWVLTGATDLWMDNVLNDYKITSIWTVVNGVKPEWENQLNTYDHLFALHGFEAKHLRITAMFRDWSKRKARFEKGYPKSQVKVLAVPKWNFNTQSLWINERISKHQHAETLANNNLPECTAQERWEKPTTYAVIKSGNKRATRVLNSYQEAEGYIIEKELGPKFEIVKREGESIRCEDYCYVKDFCHQYAQMRAQKINKRDIGG